jgi:hypothetical protein
MENSKDLGQSLFLLQEIPLEQYFMGSVALKVGKITKDSLALAVQHENLV